MCCISFIFSFVSVLSINICFVQLFCLVIGRDKFSFKCFYFENQIYVTFIQDEGSSNATHKTAIKTSVPLAE